MTAPGWSAVYAAALAANGKKVEAVRYAEKIDKKSLKPEEKALISSRFLGERATSATWTALAGSFLGVLLIVRPGGALFSWFALFPLAAAVGLALYQVTTRVVSRADDPRVTMFFSSIVVFTAFSLLLLFCPWKQSFDHDLPTLHSLLQWPLPLDLLLLGGLAVVAFVSARRVPLLAFGIGWFFVQLIPTTLIPRNDLLSERNLYLASIGLFLVVVLVSFRLIQLLLEAQSRFQLVQIGAGSLGLLAILALCYMTVERNELYRDPVLLWSDTVKKSPQRARPHNNLGHGYLLRDDWERAIEEFRIAAQMDPDYMLAQKNLRDAYLHVVGRD